MKDRRQLRRKIRQQRAALSSQQVMLASHRAAARLGGLPAFRRAKRIAAYIANDGELDPLPLLMHASRHGKQCYLPRLHPFLKGRMWFLRWRPGDRLVCNRYGIPEPLPARAARLPAWMLQWVVVPLVAFDSELNRLGMGQGFYDRGFAFRRHRRVWKRPVLCGFAHSFQATKKLVASHWDVPMDLVVTDQEVIASTDHE